jgi:hypothetical protein
MASHGYYGMVSSRLIVVKGLNRTNRIVSTGRSWHLTGPESTHATNMVWPDTSPISKLYRGNLYSNGLKDLAYMRDSRGP